MLSATDTFVYILEMLSATETFVYNLEMLTDTDSPFYWIDAEQNLLGSNTKLAKYQIYRKVLWSPIDARF